VTKAVHAAQSFFLLRYSAVCEKSDVYEALVFYWVVHIYKLKLFPKCAHDREAFGLFKEKMNMAKMSKCTCGTKYLESPKFDDQLERFEFEHCW